MCDGKCNFSTGIDGAITAGTGKLDDLGYWEHPCPECTARANAAEVRRLNESLERCTWERNEARAINNANKGRIEWFRDQIAKAQTHIAELVEECPEERDPHGGGYTQAEAAFWHRHADATKTRAEAAEADRDSLYKGIKEARRLLRCTHSFVGEPSCSQLVGSLLVTAASTRAYIAEVKADRNRLARELAVAKCKHCGGTGRIHRFISADSPDEVETVPCPRCQDCKE